MLLICKKFSRYVITGVDFEFLFFLEPHFLVNKQNLIEEMNLVVAILVTLGTAALGAGAVSIQHDDLPAIGCDVCYQSLENVYLRIQEKRESNARKHVDELEINSYLDGLCSLSDELGKWMKQIDIVENSDKTLLLSAQNRYGKVNTETKTIAKSCLDLFEEEIDREELAELLYNNNKSLGEIQEEVCTKHTSRCAKKKKYLKRKRTDYEFVPMEGKDAELEQLIFEMQKSGLGGMGMNLLHRDDVMPTDPYADEYEDMEEGDMLSEGEGNFEL